MIANPVVFGKSEMPTRKITNSIADYPSTCPATAQVGEIVTLIINKAKGPQTVVYVPTETGQEVYVGRSALGGETIYYFAMPNSDIEICDA